MSSPQDRYRSSPSASSQASQASRPPSNPRLFVEVLTCEHAHDVSTVDAQEALPVPLLSRTVHVLLDGRRAVGASVIGTVVVDGRRHACATWPWLRAEVDGVYCAGMRPWELLLRAQLWHASQSAAELLVQAPQERLRPVFDDLREMGAKSVDTGIRAATTLPRGWFLLKLPVTQALDALRARRAAHVLISRFTCRPLSARWAHAGAPSAGNGQA